MKRTVLAIALAATVGAASALAAGPFDGTWTGGSPKGGMSGVYPCPATTAKVTITNGKMTGSYSSQQYNFPINATVAPDGTVTGRWSAYPLTGKFSGNHFEGTYSSKECGADRKITLDRTG